MSSPFNRLPLMTLRRIYWRSHYYTRKLMWDLCRPNRVICGTTGQTIFLDPTDPRSVSLWCSQGNVNPRALRLWQHILDLRRWTLVLDVGANHGEMLFNVNMPADARIFAFEPNPRLARLLRQSCAKNRLPVTIVEAAVGDAAGEVTLHIYPQSSGYSSIVTPEEGTTTVPITVGQVSLADFLAAQGFPPAQASLALKIDVEGYEPAVLRGLLETLPHWADLMIMIEVHHLDADAFAEIARSFDLAILSPEGKLALVSGDKNLSITNAQDAVLVRKGDLERFLPQSGA